ncbi:MAG: ABC transporter substrate-binding protein [Bacteroidales bacterium]|nr:ABC transporter substrate-binding protein [Bacteroidales bacterium]
MRRLFLTILSVLLFSAFSRAQENKIVFMPHWTPQAQFAGYYVAFEKGFYKDAGIDVEIRHIGHNSRKNSASYLRSGEINMTSLHLLQAMVNKDGGFDIVNVLQTSQNSSILCVGHDPLPNFNTLEGKKVGMWKTGFTETAIIAADETDVYYQTIPFLFGINLFVAGAIDATLVTSYNEFKQLYYSVGNVPEENVLKFSEIGYNYPEDGLYTTADFYNQNQELVRKFAEASKRGWEYAAAHKEETLKIVEKYTVEANIATNEVLQREMLDEILKLQLDSKTGQRSFAPVSKELFDEILFKCKSAGLIMGDIDYNEFIKQ